MIKQTRKPKSDDPKRNKMPVILEPLTVEETNELLKRYPPDQGDKK